MSESCESGSVGSSKFIGFFPPKKLYREINTFFSLNRGKVAKLREDICVEKPVRPSAPAPRHARAAGVGPSRSAPGVLFCGRTKRAPARARARSSREARWAAHLRREAFVRAATPKRSQRGQRGQRPRPRGFYRLAVSSATRAPARVASRGDGALGRTGFSTQLSSLTFATLPRN